MSIDELATYVQGLCLIASEECQKGKWVDYQEGLTDAYEHLYLMILNMREGS